MSKKTGDAVWITVRFSHGSAKEGPNLGETGVRWVENKVGSASYSNYAAKCAAFLKETNTPVGEFAFFGGEGCLMT